MDFSSFSTYSDQSNWQQQQQQHQPITTTVGFTSHNTTNINQQYLPHHPLPPSQPLQSPGDGGGRGGGPSGPGGLIRPGSMAERARLANIPLPETALKCPRCDSTNTKFCYFNNYSLTQPRHFCKSCRRYWTRGGALRSVPVGGGCRRNKRTKSTGGGGGGGGSSSSGNSKSQDSNDQYNHRAQMGPPPPSSSTSLSSLLSSYNAGLIPGHEHNNNNNNILGLRSALPPLKLMSPLDFNNNFTLQYGAVSAPTYHIGGGGGGEVGGASALLTSLDQWKFPATMTHHQQLPLLDNSSTPGLYPFDSDHQNQTGITQNPGYGLVTGSGSGQYRPIFHNLTSSSSTSSSVVTATASQLASVKLEESNNQLNMSRQLFGNEQQLWNIHGASTSTIAATTSSWSDVSNNFSSPSTSNI